MPRRIFRRRESGGNVSRRMVVELEPEDLSEFKSACAALGAPMSLVIRGFIRFWLEEWSATGTPAARSGKLDRWMRRSMVSPTRRQQFAETERALGIIRGLGQCPEMAKDSGSRDVANTRGRYELEEER